MANISFLAKVLVISLLWLLPGPVSQAYGLFGDSFEMDHYDYDPYAGEIEYEVLLMELEALGLTFDSPEVQGMDNGDMWSFIERKKKQQQAATEEDQPECLPPVLP